MRLVLSLLLAFTAMAGVARAAEVTIRFPVEYAIDIAPGVANQEFKKLVEERTSGRVEVKLFPSGSLYKGLDLVQAILRGDAEMTTLTSAYWTALSKKLFVFELPYAFPDRAAFYRAADDAAFIDGIYDEVAAKGAKAIAILPYDHFAFATRKTPLLNPRDMAGLKMRGLGRVNSTILSTLGASPVSLNLVELSPALQQGVVDGLNAPIDLMLNYKWHESVRHVMVGPVYQAFYPWMVNAKWWNGLAPALRKTIQDTATEVAQRHRARAEAETQKGIEGMRAQGVEVHIQTDAEKKAWAEATQPVWTQFEAEIGKEPIAKVKSFAAAK